MSVSTSTPAAVAQAWLDTMQSHLAAKDIPAITSLFRADGWWRDVLNVSFDFNSLTPPEIKLHLERFGVPTITNLTVIDPAKAAVAVVSPALTWTQAHFSYETPEGRGKGFVRLVEDSTGAYTAYTFFTALWEIKGHEEFAFERRPLGTLHGVSEGSRKNWLDRRQETLEFEEDPTVIVLGGGQNGLMVAARLTVLGIPTLVVEKNQRIGDSWRLRYKTLVLHDPIYADHFPYLPYPPQFPKYIPKDKLANWFEHYAEAMELNVWLNSTLEPNPIYNADTQSWAVTVIRNGAPRRMNVKHLILATGFSGEARMPSFDRSEFEGTVVHSSQHKGAQAWKGKKAVVIGCCNSGHDISADFYESGSDITIVQRSSTYVMSSEHGIPGLLDGFYQENGPELQDADIMLTSLPINLVAEFHVGATKAIAVKDKVLLDGLTRAGFKLNPYAAGLFIKYFRDGGGYYIDVGCSQLIIDGKVKIKQGQEISKLTKTGVLFADGTELPADIVVCATGYSSMRETVRRLISDDVADRLHTVWGEDQQGEIPSVWRNTGVPGFWLQPGNFFQARCFSKHLALQIQMIELGLAKKDTPYPEYKERFDARF